MSHLHILAASTKTPGGEAHSTGAKERKKEKVVPARPDSVLAASPCARTSTERAGRRSAIGTAHCRNQTRSQRGWGQALRLLLGI
ncbi:hypothetical protein TRIATDRAFT_302710 [Trichoderma atroviride IMI 206040]|uniref:Uncharacterized protein n=1 Tax=Hypocrea atroviridis (strain ATCC 20476 / IMI 206040) TaxID=452589 RepID=G9P9K4_HYPAI|nr:uncharacterized protein TRIATDRAFT_302710 [Trichoderma atroviride IMI 206040]EHK40326.1 hypothetical protein TRIATDRAFT_302710 [Trichoderma atroviride IMI 206040]